MSILVILIPIALALGLFFVSGFVAAVFSDQFEDLDTPPQRMLLDDSVKEGEPLDGKQRA